MSEINVIVGENIKSLRDEKGLSLDKLAILTGVSKSMLGQIERGESSPSVNVLWKIANGLKVSFTTLTTEDIDEVQKVKIKKPVIADGGKYRLFPIYSYNHNRNFEMYRVEIDSQGRLEAEPHTKGAEEYLTVFVGGLTVKIGDKMYYVDRGESLRFDADKPHEYINDSLIKTEFSLTIFYRN